MKFHLQLITKDKVVYNFDYKESPTLECATVLISNGVVQLNLVRIEALCVYQTGEEIWAPIYLGRKRNVIHRPYPDDLAKIIQIDWNNGLICNVSIPLSSILSMAIENT